MWKTRFPYRRDNDTNKQTDGFTSVNDSEDGRGESAERPSIGKDLIPTRGEVQKKKEGIYIYIY